MLLLIITATLLSLWFFRANFKDGTLWMLATYLGVGLLLWNDYQAVSTMNDALPRIVRDFILLGMVGFVQSLAVAKRISIVTAIVILFCLFAGAYFLNEMTAGDSAPSSNADAVTTSISPSGNQLASDGELLVQINHQSGLAALKKLAADNQWEISPAFQPQSPGITELDDFYTVDIEGDIATAEAILTGAKGIIYHEPNEMITLGPLDLNAIPGEAEPANNMSIDDPFTNMQWAMRVLNMDDYYRTLSDLRPKKLAKIAILDTGVDAQHEDLKDNYISIEGKYDNDPVGHGTHCAGIAAGTTNNSIGIASLAGNGAQPFVEVTSIKVLNAAGMGTQKSIVAGIIEAADEGADVISLSLGGASNGSRQRAYSQAVKYAHDNGAIVVAAAGNSNMDAYNYSPANADGIITVTALDEYLMRAPFSNKVNRLQRGIAAPGVAIYSTTPNSTYNTYSGTSMACPFVAGLLGVMKSLDPDMQAAEAYSILQRTGKDVPDGAATGRVVQPAAAVSATIR
ncbi:S8 family serine peptidase [Lewinella sp. 4G2]|uniref:S8 family peptidase n=1 Tax=Lewinella sp. 4G2 TaxID=1803372 RepID=UPI0007B49573|nr:S8 family serine peptidase [Lewinella sp. 4G2]OAV45729.1 hypothetical protein A3850_015055 [Lewinella sp. 4G2]